MNRRQKLKWNSISGLINYVLALLCGFVVPRYILQYYGSEVYGLVASITQFLGFISIAECGIGVVIQSSLYKPLAINDSSETSRIIVSSQRFFRKIALCLAGYIVILCLVLPELIDGNFDFLYTGSLIIILSISVFAQYYIGISYRLLISADQRDYIQFSISSITLIINTALSVILIVNGCGIHIVKLLASLIFILQPLGYCYYANKHYQLNLKIKVHGEPIKQKWNGIAQHIAYVINNNIGFAVLTLFSTLVNVSIFAVYNLILTGVKKIIVSTTVGLQSLLGNMLAQNETTKIKKTFSSIDLSAHIICTIVFCCTLKLIIPFVLLYTSGVNDANYDISICAYIFTISIGIYCLRLPYNILIMAAGHYKQTQNSALIEAGINVIFSLVLVQICGLMGVVIAMFFAMLYRTTYLAWYISKSIISYKFNIFIKHIIIDVVAGIIICVSLNTFSFNFSSYSDWILSGLLVLLIATIITLGINILAFYKESKTFLNLLYKSI